MRPPITIQFQPRIMNPYGSGCPSRSFRAEVPFWGASKMNFLLTPDKPGKIAHTPTVPYEWKKSPNKQNSPE